VIKKKLVIKSLIWDDWNVVHIARHDVLPNEVEEVCTGHRIEREAYRQRIFLVGATKKERIVTVILEPTEEQGVYRPITAYDASKRSMKAYQEENKRGGEEAA
jgi:uncharacterized DUF497 family protein